MLRTPKDVLQAILADPANFGHLHTLVAADATHVWPNCSNRR